MKIRTLFIFALIFFSISSIIAYAIYCSGSMNTIAEQQYERLYSDIAVNEGKNVEKYVNKLSSAAAIVAADKNISSFDMGDSAAKDTAEDAAKEYIISETGIIRVAVLNASGEVVVSAANGNDVDYKLFEKDMLDRMSQGEAYISTVFDSNGKESSYELVAPVMLSDRTIMVYFSNSELDTIIKAGTFPTNGRVVIIDGFGHIVDGAYVGTLEEVISKSGYIEYNTINSAITDSANLNKSLSFERGRNPLAAYTVSSSGNWYVSAIAEVDKAYNYSTGASAKVVGLVVGLSVLFIAIYVVAIIIVTKPLAIIEKTLLKIHRGDHDSRIEINSKDEYGEIASSFNDLIDNLIVSERRYRNIVEMSDDIVFEWNMKTNNVTFSNNFNKKFSYRAASDHFSDSFFLKGKVHPEDNERYRKDLTKLEKGEEFKDNTYRWKNVYGDYIWFSMKTSTIRDADGNIIKIIGVLSDVDRAKKGEMLLIQRASYDALTGVYNRETIENVINGEIQKMAEGNDSFAILFVDIDDFKVYNDKYSHATGDQVLKFVTDSIGEVVEDFGFIGRYGGDEFIVCIRNSSTNSPENVARDILAKLKAGFVCDMEDHLSVSVSIGIYIVNDSAKTVEEIISIADDAMYKIKKTGKSSFGVVS